MATTNNAVVLGVDGVRVHEADGASRLVANFVDVSVERILVDRPFHDEGTKRLCDVILHFAARILVVDDAVLHHVVDHRLANYQTVSHRVPFLDHQYTTPEYRATARDMDVGLFAAVHRFEGFWVWFGVLGSFVFEF